MITPPRNPGYPVDEPYGCLIPPLTQSRREGYDCPVKFHLKKVIIVTCSVVGVFLVTTLLVFALSFSPSVSEKHPVVGALIIGTVIGTASLPLFVWLALRPSSLGNYAGYTLEEIELDEDELAEAVSNWVFAEHKRRIEGPVRFLEDEDGNVNCRVTVRKD